MVGGTAVAFAETGNDSGNGRRPLRRSPPAILPLRRPPRPSGGRPTRGPRQHLGWVGQLRRLHAPQPSVGRRRRAALAPDSNKPLPPPWRLARLAAAASTPPSRTRRRQRTDCRRPGARQGRRSRSRGSGCAGRLRHPSTTSWLPDSPIVPGAHVKLAQDQITASQASLKQATSGNILASLGSFGPQAALATAQALLGLWASTIEGAQKQVADTVGQPLIHNIAQARLQNELTYTKLAGLSLQTASALITPLALFGADVAPTKALVDQAQQNGKVYAKVPVQMVAGTEPWSRRS